jgi:hypothetical protein
MSLSTSADKRLKSVLSVLVAKAVEITLFYTGFSETELIESSTVI